MNVLVVFGGASPEHEVSIRSARTVIKGLEPNHKVYACYITKQDNWVYINNIDDLDNSYKIEFLGINTWKYDGQQIRVDVVFPIVHGVGGEDGQLQKKLDDMGVKYVGTRAQASELCFDKIATKEALRASNIAVVEEFLVDKSDPMPVYQDLINKLGGETLFVKPSRSGSSVGVHKINSEENLAQALEDAFLYDSKVLIERAVSEPRELEMAVLETEPNVFRASLPGEILADGEFYSYDSKYASESKTKTIVNPNDLSAEISQEMQEVALKANDVLNCRGMVRVDFLYDGLRKVLYLNEVNTLPGFTNISMYPMLWNGSGIQLEELLDTLVNVASRS